MEIIVKIQNLIINNDIENAYETIMENESLYINNAQYWNLRGMLCFKVQEYNAAISCYKTSIRLEESYLDSYYNLAYTYKIIGEKIKSVLYGGIALRYTDALEFVDDIKSLYEDEVLVSAYHNILEEVKSSYIPAYNEVNLIKYVSAQFNDIDAVYIEELAKEDIAKTWAYVNKDLVITSKEILSIEDFMLNYKCGEWDVVVPYDINYIDITRNMAIKGVKECFIIVPINRKFELIYINKVTMSSLKRCEYKSTISLNLFNAADANVYALIKYMPEEYKHKYKLNIINGREVFSIENMIKVPLISVITISGFNTFVNYPKFTYNIDVGHGSVGFKCAGLLDKGNKNFAFTPEEYKNIDKVCITSTMNMLILSAMAAIPENKYVITGNPRTDILMLSDGKTNLEKIINRSITGKKVIFNMPTFHTHENSGLVSGSKELNDCIKIKNFNYEEFDKFLKENEAICISKVHHAEERTVESKAKNRKLSNLIFISNSDLENNNLNLYEILNCADCLVTDYSSIYGDFLFMDKPTIFVNEDIDEYRQTKGLLLEPYDYWTAGPKVKTQEDLEKGLFEMLNNRDVYKEKRKELKKVFYQHDDSKSTVRVWSFIDDLLR